MVICSLDSLKEERNGIRKENSRVVTTSYWPQKNERKVKDRIDQTPGFDLVINYCFKKFLTAKIFWKFGTK